MSDDLASSPLPSEELLRTALNDLDDLVFIFDQEGRLRYWNRAVDEATDRDGADLADETLEALVTADDAERVREAMAEALETGHASCEVWLVLGEGNPVPYEFHLSRVSGAGEDEIAGVGREIASRRATEHRRQAILDRMTDAFFAVDEGWQFTYVNDRARSVLAAAMGEDVDAEEIVGRNLWEAIPEVVDTPFYEHYHEAMETQEPVTLEEYYEPLETWFQVRAFPSPTGLSVYFRDITDRKRHEQALQEHERVLQEMYEVTADAERSFEQQVETLLELGCEVLGTTYGSLSRVEGEDYVFEIVHAPDGAISPGELVPLSATHCERAVTTRKTLVLSDVAEDAPDLTQKKGYQEWGIACYLGAPVIVEGDVRGTFCFYDDRPREEPFTEWEVTLVDLMSQWVSYELARQRANERLEQQNEQLEEFAGIVSHDLRNPLNILEGSLELAAETGEQAHFQRCRRAIERMETLIDDLLALARAGETITDTEAVDLAEVVEVCWAAVDTADADLQIETDRIVEADRGRLRQLLENLLRNAIEHGGKEVCVTVGDHEDGFYVADDGPGIPPEDRDEVFNAGYSSEDSGTGFGLNIVEQVAEAHGWTVTVGESATGGARFEFSGIDAA